MHRSSRWIAQALGAQLHGNDVELTGTVETDSREIRQGSLFVARRGENSDGHNYLDAAERNGAVAAIVEHLCDSPLTQIIVEDSTIALGELARAYLSDLRSRQKLDVIAMTGSVGKTTTKDLLAAIMGADAPTVAPQLSFNNEVGLPLTVLRADESTRHLVLEMGASGPGHIAYLTRIAPPDAGIELMVGHAHLGGFGSVEGVRDAKAELIQGLVPSGISILNFDDPHVMEMAAHAPGRVVTFSASGNTQADSSAHAISLDEQGKASFELHLDGRVLPVHLGLVGIHHVANALAAITGAWTLGIDLDQACAAVEGRQPASPHRMSIHELTLKGRKVTLIDDSYNANLDSFRAGCKAAGDLAAGRQLIVVAGGMLELGEASQSTHEQVARFFDQAGAHCVLALGEDSQYYFTERGEDHTHRHLRNVDEVLSALDGILEDNSVVFIKGSNGSGAWKVADHLVEEGTL